MLGQCKPAYLSILLTTLLATPSIAQQIADTEAKEHSKKQVTEQNIEKLTVYGRHNSLVLNSGTATKSNMELMETPAAVVVVDEFLLKQQSNSTLQDAIRNVSGLSQAGNNYGIGDNLAIRGLGANYVVDGMYGGAGLGNTYNPTRTLTNIESIEVLKGPATGLYGIGSAGGVINLIEKKPQFVEQTEFMARLGSWDHYSITADTMGVISADTAYRVVAGFESDDGYRGLSSERAELYLSLQHQFNNEHTVTFSAAYIDDENQIDSVGYPVRILNHASIVNGNGGVDWQNLVNDADGDNDGVFGIQLTDAQRQQLASSIASEDGLNPYDLGEQGLISPLSEPNQGEETRFKIRHDWQLSDDTTVMQQLQYRKYDSEYTRQTGAYNYVYWNRRGEINANPRAPLVIDGEIYPFAARRQEYRNQVSSETGYQYFADVKSLWQWGSVEGEHLMSVNYENRDMSLQSRSAYDADGSSGSNPIPYILDIRHPNWPQGDFDDYDNSLRTNYDKTLSAYGIGIQEVVYFTDSLTGRIGAAYNTIEQKYQHKGTDRSPLATPEADTDDSGSTYNVGLNYRLIDSLAVFANYAKGRTAYSVLGSVNGESDRPNSESESFDVGIRFTAFDEDMLGSLVWFETSRTNLRYANPLFNDNPEDPEYNVSVAQYFYDDEDRTQGVEFDLNFTLLDNWSLNANYTYQDAISIRSREKSGQTKGVPKNYARFWTNYQVNTRLLPEPISFNIGMCYEDERAINSTSFGLPDAVIDSYTVWDAGLSYQQSQWDVRLNIDNLFDKTYYSKAMFLGGLPGNPRNVTLTLRYSL